MFVEGSRYVVAAQWTICVAIATFDQNRATVAFRYLSFSFRPRRRPA